MPRATTAACEVLPPRLVRMPCDGEEAVDVLGLGLLAHEDDLRALLAEDLGAVGVEDRLAARGAGRGGQTGRERVTLCPGSRRGNSICSRCAGFDAHDGFLAREQALLVHLDRGAHRRRGVHLAVAGLQAIQRAALDRELEVLHFAVVLLEPVAEFDELA